MDARVLLVDDHQIMREGLRALLDSEPDMSVVAEAGDGRAAVEMAREFGPNVVIMDIVLPLLNGIEATRQILAALPLTKVIALSMHAENHFVADMLRAGASGYVLKECGFEELRQAIDTVLAGQTYLTPNVATVVVDGYLDKTDPTTESPAASLTPREREILQLIAEGHPTKHIGNLLGVSTKTVQTHRQQAMQKLGIDSVAGLTKYALRTGMTSLEH